MAGELPNSVVIPAALAGLAVGATVVTLEFSVLFFSEPEPSSQLWILPTFWVGALIVFLIGFIFLGVPAWFAAHLLHRQNWYDAFLLGAVLAGGAEFLFSLPSPQSSSSVAGYDLVVSGRYTTAGWVYAFATTFAIAVAGGASGLTIWWIAYRKR